MRRPQSTMPPSASSARPDSAPRPLSSQSSGSRSMLPSSSTASQPDSARPPTSRSLEPGTSIGQVPAGSWGGMQYQRSSSSDDESDRFPSLGRRSASQEAGNAGSDDKVWDGFERAVNRNPRSVSSSNEEDEAVVVLDISTPAPRRLHGSGEGPNGLGQRTVMIS
eukprot:TRINITY_DN19114_c0_g1_i1.p3 TRINITY_DN19114_c0_g1~~TRINITY_DN19114_c0_g1_i1.p3  ORF type:complete len:165 (-),score=39.91 TRINITY_DN19114_c0_g1_i1:430-924(-)